MTYEIGTTGITGAAAESLNSNPNSGVGAAASSCDSNSESGNSVEGRAEADTSGTVFVVAVEGN